MACAYRELQFGPGDHVVLLPSGRGFVGVKHSPADPTAPQFAAGAGQKLPILEHGEFETAFGRGVTSDTNRSQLETVIAGIEDRVRVLLRRDIGSQEYAKTRMRVDESGCAARY
jgi:hypothetical protein